MTNKSKPEIPSLRGRDRRINLDFAVILSGALLSFRAERGISVLRKPRTKSRSFVAKPAPQDDKQGQARDPSAKNQPQDDALSVILSGAKDLVVDSQRPEP